MHTYITKYVIVKRSPADIIYNAHIKATKKDNSIPHSYSIIPSIPDFFWFKIQFA